MAAEIPSDWIVRPLGKMAKRIRRRLTAEPENILMISSTQGWIPQSEKYGRFMAGESLKNYVELHTGEFAYNKGNSKTYPYGCVFRLEGWGRAAVPNVYISFALDDRQIHHGFASHFFAAGGLDSQLQRLITSTARSNGLLNIAADDFFACDVPLPPAPEQRKIAAILSSVGDAIATTRKVIEQTKRVKQGLLQTLMTRGIGHTRFKKTEVGEIPEAWEVVTLESLLAPCETPMRSGPFGSALLKKELVPEGIPLLGIDNIHEEEFRPTYSRYVTPEKFDELQRYAVRPRDVVITIMGTVGRTCVVPPGTGQALSSKHLWTMTFDPSRYLPELISLQLNWAPWVQKHFKSQSQGGIMKAIRSDVLRTTPLPLPPPAEQQQIASILASCVAVEEAAQREAKPLEQLKRGLIQDLLTGRVRVQPD
jgi:type I restriction enzyme, S subunit